MARKFFISFAFLFFICAGFPYLFAAETAQGQVEFNIRFYDRQVYYVESYPIYVQITITNNSPYTYRFKLADDRVFSIDFDIRTMTNRALPLSDSLIRKRNQNNNVFFREISIESGESFSFTEDLREYISFSQPGSYRVRAFIYPELYRSVLVPAIETNYLSLSIRPELIPGPDGIPLDIDTATGAVLVRQSLPPDEVVTYMITARQQSQWERFFLYLDPEAMLQRDAYQRRRYLSENEAGRRTMLETYKRNLQNAVIDEDISVIPTSFSIIRTEYNNYQATVIAVLRFRHTSFTELRQYSYFLERRDNIWIIVDYSVQAMGTAAND
ncbi:MAG: hypothetical protein FWC17_04065 [Treponema sp.]|nr:hypothetical protein [Treponema sp.]